MPDRPTMGVADLSGTTTERIMAATSLPKGGHGDNMILLRRVRPLVQIRAVWAVQPLGIGAEPSYLIRASLSGNVCT